MQLAKPGIHYEKSISWQSSDVFLAACLGVATLLSRLPFQAALLNNFDAVNYALALDHFDMRLAQPQAPGYPLYILLGRVVYLFFQDHRAALVWISMAFSGLAVAAIYLAGQTLFTRRVGLIAALLLATSTVFWYTGEIAAPYTIDLFASAVVGWLCYRLLTAPSSKLVWITALAVGLAGALRLQTLVFLLPLFLFALQKQSWKSILGGVALACVVFGMFFVPAVMLSGGLAGFLRSMQGVVPIFRDARTLIRTTRWVRFFGNAKVILGYTIQILGEPVIPFVLLGLFTREQPIKFWRNTRLLFLFIWVLPSWIVYFLVWPGNMGTMLVSMPTFFLLAAVGLDWLLERGQRGAIFGSTVLLFLLAWGTLVFTVVPMAPLGKSFRQFANYANIRKSTDSYQKMLSLVSEVPANSTVVFAEDFRILQFYLPQYHIFSFPDFRSEDPEVVKAVVSIKNGEWHVLKDIDAALLIPPGTQRIILAEPPKGFQMDNRLSFEEISKDNYAIQIISISPDQQLNWTAEGIRLMPIESLSGSATKP
jgi:hypothetical protein